ncbi:MAG: ABC transporter substrate-binding protein [Rhodospirillum sp.]|nr:ABC transporter substrate-binding protein [Rhodospirillum sp.]MCF8491218.1 ABC transporter substrate-binding protein [Rhodospirillum sp.]MCF8500876.1 ABC transporter substrate-binding protein [Rhodospirillum sp.]
MSRFSVKTVSMRRGLMAATALAGLMAATSAQAADCPAVTVDDMQGLSAPVPYQFELADFQKAASCELTFQENPAAAEMNGEITGNPALPALADRLPKEPLVLIPYNEIGTYGGTLTGLSKGTESGTSDVLSLRHVNFARYADDLRTIVPNVAKSWTWNDDYTVLTLELREGHKWSDGAPFTAEDVVFWYNDLVLNKDIYPETPSRWLFAGEPMTVEAVTPTEVRMTFPVPNPGIMSRFAVDFGQPFQPKHFLSKYMSKYNPDADKLAKEMGKDSALDALKVFYNGSDWKDVPTPLLSGDAKMVTPTLESHIVVADTSTGRKLVANPYFHMVDTAGNQLPYVNKIDEEYIKDKEVQNLKMTSGEVSYKGQAVYIEDYPLLKENEEKGGYKVFLSPGLGENVFYAFNTTDKDPELAKIFNDVRFREAMSLAMNRDEINDVVLLGQGRPMQITPADPATVAFITDDMLNHMVQYDPDAAKAKLAEMGLKDSDGDGVLERFDGKPLIVRLVYSNQGAPVKMHELVRDYWSAVGLRVDLKEVTSDEYRTAGNNNDLDITTWKNDNTSAPSISQSVERLVPPFGNYFNPGTGFAWAQWKSTGGKDGVEPPEDVKKVYELAEKFIQYPLGTDESNKLGAEIMQLHVDNLWKIGTVGDVTAPTMYKTDVGNFREFTAKAYDYYWSYPYRANQWFIKK